MWQPCSKEILEDAAEVLEEHVVLLQSSPCDHQVQQRDPAADLAQE